MLKPPPHEFTLPRFSGKCRQEIASIVSQVVKLTGGEKGDGAGAISPPKPRAVSTAGGNRSCGDRTAADERDHGQRSQVRRQGAGAGGGSDGKGRVVAALAAPRGAVAEAEHSSRPELLLTLQENLESLGVNRAALQRDNPEGGGGSGSGSSRSIRDSVHEGGQVARMPTRGPAAAGGADGARGAASGAIHDASRDLAAAAGRAAAGEATALETKPAAGEEKKEDKLSPEPRATAATPGLEGTNPGRAGGDDDRLRFLHESYIARPEPSLLPLYPPGDPFLVCNHGNHGGAGGTAARRSPLAVEGSSAWLVRVPHEHFLRMPLSPSMLEDHSMSSYQRALAGLCSSEKKPGRM